MTDFKDNKAVKFLSDLLGPEKVSQWKKFLTENVPVIPAANPEPAKFGEGVLADGTKIKYEGDALTVGAMIMVVAQDGTELPAPDGELELQDGTKLKVVQGKIAEITPVTPEVPAVPAAQAATPSGVDQLVNALKELVNGKFEAQSKVNEVNTKEINELKDLISKQSEVIKGYQEFFNALVNLPTGEPIKKEVFTSKKKSQIEKHFNH